MRTARAKVTEVVLVCPACGMPLDEKWNEVEGFIRERDGDSLKIHPPEDYAECPNCMRELRLPRTVVGKLDP